MAEDGRAENESDSPSVCYLSDQICSSRKPVYRRSHLQSRKGRSKLPPQLTSLAPEQQRSARECGRMLDVLCFQLRSHHQQFQFYWIFSSCSALVIHRLSYKLVTGRLLRYRKVCSRDIEDSSDIKQRRPSFTSLPCSPLCCRLV